CAIALIGSAHRSPVRADDEIVIDISATHGSKYASTGQHNYAFDTNYLVGNIAFVGTYNNYFVFNLAAIPSTHKVVAAELFLQQPSYLSPDPSETYTLFEVSTPVGALLTPYSA